MYKSKVHHFRKEKRIYSRVSYLVKWIGFDDTTFIAIGGITNDKRDGKCNNPSI